MRRMIITFMVALQFLHSAAQTISETEAISEFLGSSSEEELDSYEVERLHDFFLRPLRLNLSSASSQHFFTKDISCLTDSRVELDLPDIIPN
mgnify:CR=1 FL=1